MSRLQVLAIALLGTAVVAACGGESSEARESTPAARAAVSPLTGPALLAALRRGGYVVYFRHAATDFTMSDPDTDDLADCRTQRNLNAKGRADARAIGQA